MKKLPFLGWRNQFQNKKKYFKNVIQLFLLI